jgi:DNA-binding PadR family transcriptional regulator
MVAFDAPNRRRHSLDLLILRALVWQPMHGFEIANWLEERSSGALDVDDSALYQGLYRLEGRT